MPPEMVEEGRVKREDKRGNDISDESADRGAEITDIKAAAFGHVYIKRRKFYKIVMQQNICPSSKSENWKREKGKRT